MPFNPFSVLSAKVFAGVSAFLLIALGVQTARLSWAQRDAANYKLANDTMKKAYTAAAATAEAKAIAAKLTTEAAYRAKAEQTDADYQTALSRAQRAADAYAQRMRTQGPGGTSRGPAAPAPGNGPESPDRPGADAVILTRDDFDILVENSVRLEAAHNWAKTLDVSAIPDPAF